jgi:hypothetical protein
MTLDIFGNKISIEVFILIGIIYLILACHTFCGCCRVEGFTGANTNNGESAPFSLSKSTPPNTNKWFTPNLVVKPGYPLSKAVKNILNREPQPVPLPKGEMLMFANTPFKASCCPNAYSTSTGCACMTTEQYNYLITRGGNNIPYSEY